MLPKQWGNYYFDITDVQSLIIFHVASTPWYLDAIFYYFIRVLEVVVHSLPTLKEQVNHQGTLEITVCIFEQMFKLRCQPTTTGFGSQWSLSVLSLAAPRRLFETGHTLDYGNWQTLRIRGFMKVILCPNTSALAVFHQASNKDFHHPKAVVALLP